MFTFLFRVFLLSRGFVMVFKFYMVHSGCLETMPRGPGASLAVGKLSCHFLAFDFLSTLK